jgi:hypothetical protein
MQDFVGIRFGALVVLSEAKRLPYKHRQVRCRCDCGTEAVKRQRSKERRYPKLWLRTTRNQHHTSDEARNVDTTRVQNLDRHHRPLREP